MDGSSYLYRAFHALPPLTNSKGEPTGAVLGVLNMLAKLEQGLRPDLIAVVMDAPGPHLPRRDVRRVQGASPAHAGRPAVADAAADRDGEGARPAAAADQGVEADDVIGTLARRAAADGLDSLISTSDKDMAQLVDGRIRLVNTMTGRRSTATGVKDKFDVPPEQIIDYLALVGDTSDNIPGVPKVGPKTAAKWLSQYGTLDASSRTRDEIKGKVGEKPARAT